MPCSSSSGRTSSRKHAACRSAMAGCASRCGPAARAGDRPSALRTAGRCRRGASARPPAPCRTRRGCDAKIARNLARSSSGWLGSSASASTRALKSSQDSSRLRNRSSGSSRRAPGCGAGGLTGTRATASGDAPTRAPSSGRGSRRRAGRREPGRRVCCGRRWAGGGGAAARGGATPDASTGGGRAGDASGPPPLRLLRSGPGPRRAARVITHGGDSVPPPTPMRPSAAGDNRVKYTPASARAGVRHPRRAAGGGQIGRCVDVAAQARPAPRAAPPPMRGAVRPIRRRTGAPAPSRPRRAGTSCRCPRRRP